MERLTYRVNTGIQDVVLTDSKSVEECLEWENVLERLAEYEDIGLTPEQLREIDKLYAEKCKEMADAKLLKLPCAVGDTVYVVERSQTGSPMIAKTTADSFYCALWMLDGKFGRSIFPTLEEAEAALKEAERRQEENEIG